MSCVNYKKSLALSMDELLEKNVQMFVDTSFTIAPHIKSGVLKPIAVTGSRRSFQFAAVPTGTESGYPNLENYVIWSGLFAPAGTPRELLSLIHAQVQKAMGHPDITKMLVDTDSELMSNTPEKFRAFVEDEVQWWKNVPGMRDITEIEPPFM
jgi:tripartite-type tricarboxylate transporter receptor subunit TctC